MANLGSLPPFTVQRACPVLRRRRVEAFQKAEDEDKPVFLSVGYSSCHWCHVMAPEVAVEGP